MKITKPIYVGDFTPTSDRWICICESKQNYFVSPIWTRIKRRKRKKIQVKIKYKKRIKCYAIWIGKLHLDMNLKSGANLQFKKNIRC